MYRCYIVVAEKATGETVKDGAYYDISMSEYNRILSPMLKQLRNKGGPLPEEYRSIIIPIIEKLKNEKVNGIGRDIPFNG